MCVYVHCMRVCVCICKKTFENIRVMAEGVPVLAQDNMGVLLYVVVRV